jgi:hypothetical protein
MKRIILFLLFSLSTLLSLAQDVIYTKSGSRIYCTVLEVADSKVYYGIGRDVVRYSIDQSQVKEIKYATIYGQNQLQAPPEYRQAFTAGFLEGGGGLVGIDWEFMIGKQIALQVGTGLISIGGSLNIHFKPDIRSSFVALQYWHQGFGDSYVQSLIGPSYVFRARKIFTAQLGFGISLGTGPGWPIDTPHPDTMLTYAIGIYFPMKSN